MVKNNCGILFVGAFDLLDDNNIAASAAGNQVQLEILDCLENIGAVFSNKDVQSVSLKQIRTWPFGPFLWPGFRGPRLYMPPFINLAGLKRFLFSFFLFFLLLLRRPDVIFKYNITAVEAFALLIYRKINRSAVLVAIIQDVHYSKNNSFGIRNFLELLAMKLVSKFDILIPISEKIGIDFSFSPNKTRVFRGGLTRQGRCLLSGRGDDISHYAVFAGALVPYNGIDVLIRKWTSENIDMDLHIFGKGVSESAVRDAASKNPRIIFHGFRPEEEISHWQKKALINFCLRYSEGIEAGYFFPSKLYNIICAPGAVVANNFEGFPSELSNSCLMLADDLSDFSQKIEKARNSTELISMRNSRRKWIEENGNWNSVVREIFEGLSLKSRRG
ncbi:glycosyltransferase [Azonexus caeni]|uniref:glycosyltransferase n=1 Tax=Azonexus caeni TaxID=266126 RepID=UPI003A8A3893